MILIEIQIKLNIFSIKDFILYSNLEPFLKLERIVDKNKNSGPLYTLLCKSNWTLRKSHEFCLKTFVNFDSGFSNSHFEKSPMAHDKS